MKEIFAFLMSFIPLIVFSQPVSIEKPRFDEAIAILGKLSRFEPSEFGDYVTVEMKGSTQIVTGWIFSENEDTIVLLTSNGILKTVGRASVQNILKPDLETIADELPPNERLPSMVLCPYYGCESIRIYLKSLWLHGFGRDDLAAKLLTSGDGFNSKTASEAFANLYFNEMLSAYSIDRDYESAIKFGTYLGAPEYENFELLDVAIRLTKQLQDRPQDFKSLIIPDTTAWRDLQKKLPRKKLVEFLADRLHLLNCIQTSQPGGINYQDTQYSVAFSAIPYDEKNPHLKLEASEVINPYVEIMNLHLNFEEAEYLLPYLSDTTYIPSYSFWRDFSSNRVVHKFNWLIADLLFSITNRNWITLQHFDTLSDLGKKQEIEKIRTWLRQRKSATKEELVSEILATTHDEHEFANALNIASREKYVSTTHIMASRFDDFELGQGWPTVKGMIVKTMFDIGLEQDRLQIRKWSNSSDDRWVVLWTSLYQLRHDPEMYDSALVKLKNLLVGTNADASYYPYALQTLVGLNEKAAFALAQTLFDYYQPPYYLFEGNALNLMRVMLFNKSQGAFEFLRQRLSDTSVYHSQKKDGMIILNCDRYIYLIDDWRKIGTFYNTKSDLETRKKYAHDQLQWLTEQFALIKNDQPHEIQGGKSFPNVVPFLDFPR